MTINDVDVSYLNDLLDSNKHLIVKPASFYEKIPQEHLSLWCHHNGIYCLPTNELIDWLKNHLEIGKTIEIGAGIGTIGRTLNIPITDSCYMRNNFEVFSFYKLLKQPITAYPSDIIEMDYEAAIEYYRPNVVIGAWITHKYNEKESWREGNQFGIDEKNIIERVKKYIMIGNRKVHSKKPILEFFHQEFEFPWLYSRSMSKENVIYLWEKNETSSFCN